MAVACLNTRNTNMSGHMQNQLTRSLERILEDANLSGELKLSGRKLKDFPKAAGKYKLSDTVFADLSRNRFCELPEDITTLAFLERLLVYHNAIRSIPETVRGLHSLTYLDLRNNQLSLLPREICFLPLQVLLVSNNRLVSLPEELGRMEDLTELDAACNQITHLPARMGDLRSIRSLTLRSNQLVYLPRELTYLNLVFLDISSNKISTLPVELRNMTSLVDLELSNNPLTSPPAFLCVRGLVHVFKHLETISTNNEKSKTSDEKGTLRRQISAKQNSLESQKNRRAHVDSGYCTSDGLDKKWTQDYSHDNNIAKWSPTPMHVRSENIYVKQEYAAPLPTYNVSGNDENILEDEIKKVNYAYEQMERKTDLSPESETVQDNINKPDEKKSLGNIQTYREYKEALRQQRSQESASIYRSKEVQTPDSVDSPLSNLSSFKSSPSQSTYSSNQSSPLSPHHVQKLNQLNANGFSSTQSVSQTSSPLTSPNRNVNLFEDSAGVSKKPVQKVIPSRNTTTSTYQNQSPTNGNHITSSNGVSNGNGKLVTSSDYAYVKPNSPLMSSSILSHNGSTNKAMTVSAGYVNNAKPGQKTNKSVSWNREVPEGKLSFTMRREFDKQKEETELIKQLRNILETRLKMSLPEDIGQALTDGVVLCHLANHVRERSVGSIHVPSPTVPKLTMARCRKNVDNFLDACRKIGVDEELICSVSDIVPSLELEDCNNDNNQNCLRNPPNPSAMFQTIAALLNCSTDHNKAHQRPPLISSMSSNPATNTSIQFENNNYFQKMEVKVNNIEDDNLECTDDEECVIKMCDYSQRSVPISLDLSSNVKRKRKYASTKYSKYSHGVQKDLNEIIEECEYDSDIGKFKCRTTSNQDDVYDDSETCSSSSLTFTPTNENQLKQFNDLNSPSNRITSALKETDLNINTRDNTSSSTPKIVMKRIEFFESNHQTKEKILNDSSKTNTVDVFKNIKDTKHQHSTEDSSNIISTVLCLVTFILTVVFVSIYPLPN